jgi:hypothetical protein
MEFKSEKVQKFLKEKGHHIFFLASSRSKAFYSERAIRTYRTRLSILRKHLGQDTFSKSGGWKKFNNHIVMGYNHSAHSSLLNMTPQKIISNTSSVDNQKLQESRTRNNISLKQYLKEQKTHIETSQWWVGQYVRLIVEPKDVFEKKSVMTKIGTEIFQVTRSRPSKSDISKDPLLTLMDMTKLTIDGVFRLNEIKLIPKKSRFHPKNKSFKKTVTEVHKVTTKGRLKIY